MMQDSAHEPDEQALLTRLAAGDRRAAELLVDRTYRVVFASLMRLTGGNEDLAADLTQDTYRKAWAAIDRFDRRSQLGTWLYRIAYNTFLNHVRRPARLLPIDEQRAAAVADPQPGQDDRMRRDEARARLRRAVVGLPEDLRFTVTARFWAELPVAEIARQENVTGAAIRKRLKKAKSMLRLTLAEDP